MPPIATKNGEPVKRRRRARSRRRAAARERRAPVEGPVRASRHAGGASAAEPPLPPPRRFQPLWTTEETDACFIVRERQWEGTAYGALSESLGTQSLAGLDAGF